MYSIWSLAFIIKDYDKIFAANMATGLQSFAFKRPVTSLFCDLEKPNKKRSLLFLFKILNLKLQKTTWGIFKKLLAWVFALLLNKVKILKPKSAFFLFYSRAVRGHEWSPEIMDSHNDWASQHRPENRTFKQRRRQRQWTSLENKHLDIVSRGDWPVPSTNCDLGYDDCSVFIASSSQ